MIVFLHTELAYSIWTLGDARAYALATFLSQELIDPILARKEVSEDEAPMPRICPFDLAFFSVSVSELLAEAYSLGIESGIEIVERPSVIVQCEAAPFGGYENSFFVTSGLDSRYKILLEKRAVPSGRHAFDLSFALEIAAKALTEENVALIVNGGGGMRDRHLRQAEDASDLSSFG